jgi:hypothetical protein
MWLRMWPRGIQELQEVNGLINTEKNVFSVSEKRLQDHIA